jgi:hypothetical protein
MLTLIQTAKLNDVDPQAWLADVLEFCLQALRANGDRAAFSRKSVRAIRGSQNLRGDGMAIGSG